MVIYISSFPDLYEKYFTIGYWLLMFQKWYCNWTWNHCDIYNDNIISLDYNENILLLTTITGTCMLKNCVTDEHEFIAISYKFCNEFQFDHFMKLHFYTWAFLDIQCTYC